MSEEEKEAIETLKEVASDEFDTLGDDISPKMAQNILNVLEKQQKEIEELKEKEKNLIFQLKDEEKELIEVTQNIISKDKIRNFIKEQEYKLRV